DLCQLRLILGAAWHRERATLMKVAAPRRIERARDFASQNAPLQVVAMRVRAAMTVRSRLIIDPLLENQARVEHARRRRSAVIIRRGLRLSSNLTCQIPLGHATGAHGRERRDRWPRLP